MRAVEEPDDVPVSHERLELARAMAEGEGDDGVHADRAGLTAALVPARVGMWNQAGRTSLVPGSRRPRSTMGVDVPFFRKEH